MQKYASIIPASHQSEPKESVRYCTGSFFLSLSFSLKNTHISVDNAKWASMLSVEVKFTVDTITEHGAGAD